MSIKLEDDLVGQRLNEQLVERTENDQIVSFEWECLELVREIYSSGVWSFIRAVGISDKLLKELIGARSEFESSSLGGKAADRCGGSPQFEGLFLIGVALGSQVRTTDPGLATRIEQWSLDPGLEGPCEARIVDGEISSGLHEGAVPVSGVPLVEQNLAFEGGAYADAERELDALLKPEAPSALPLVATPPGFSPTGLLDLARVILGAAEPGFGFAEPPSPDAPLAGLTVLAREWLSAGIWVGMWVRARQLELGVVGELRGVSGDEDAEVPENIWSQSIYQLVCGWEYGQSSTSTLAWARSNREGVRMPANPDQADDAEIRKAYYFLGRLQVQISIYSCQATGDFSWWPVYSFLRKGDIVLIRLAPFPRISREEMKEWFPGQTFGQMVLEDGASLLPDEQPPLLGLERNWTQGNIEQAAEDLWHNVPYLRWLIPETPETGNVNDGLDGLAVVTSDAVWEGGCWRATVGMVRPFVRSVRFEEFSKTTKAVRVPLFPEKGKAGDGFDPSSLTMLANLQFLPDRVELGDRDLSSILRIASNPDGAGSSLPQGAAGHAAGLEKGGALEESPQALVTDFERLKLVRENLRLGRSIEEMSDISPWPVKGTWLEGSEQSLFPGRLKLDQKPVLNSYPLWALERQVGSRGPVWRDGGVPEFLLESGGRFKGDHPAVGAKLLLEALGGVLVEPSQPGPPAALLLAVPSDALVAPLQEAFTMIAKNKGFRLEATDPDLFLQAEEVVDGKLAPAALREDFWSVDPEGVWSRPGSVWELECSDQVDPDDRGGVKVRLFVVGTQDLTALIDVESVSAQIARSVEFEDGSEGR